MECNAWTLRGHHKRGLHSQRAITKDRGSGEGGELGLAHLRKPRRGEGSFDLSQVTIPTDNVDASFIKKPQHWNISLIRRFMLFIGPISSIFDFLTFFLMLRVFSAGEMLFHTGWFVESLATQILVLFIIRTAGNPLHSRPSSPLAVTTLLIVAVGVLLPSTSPGRLLGFTPLPGLYFLFLVAMTTLYLLLVELVKRRLMRKYA